MHICTCTLLSTMCTRTGGGGVGRILMRQSADRWCCSYAPASITICTCAHALSKQMRAQPSHPPTHAAGCTCCVPGCRVETHTHTEVQVTSTQMYRVRFTHCHNTSFNGMSHLFTGFGCLGCT
jgi:hypothetical protein